jgi:hypothetical protein
VRGNAIANVAMSKNQAKYGRRCRMRLNRKSKIMHKTLHATMLQNIFGG